MRQLLTIVLLLSTITVFSQEKKNLFKSIYEDFFKYSTFYIAGDIENPKEEVKDYFVRTNPDGGLYDIPVVVDGTDYYDFDYRYGFGVRKLARFDYEFKGKHYYDGTESSVGLAATNSSFLGRGGLVISLITYFICLATSLDTISFINVFSMSTCFCFIVNFLYIIY
jgi:hypothetical protein